MSSSSMVPSRRSSLRNEGSSCSKHKHLMKSYGAVLIVLVVLDLVWSLLLSRGEDGSSSWYRNTSTSTARRSSKKEQNNYTAVTIAAAPSIISSRTTQQQQQQQQQQQEYNPRHDVVDVVDDDFNDTDDRSSFLMGHWINDTQQTRKPYELTNDFLPHWNQSLFFWNNDKCKSEPNHQLRWIPNSDKNYEKKNNKSKTEHENKYNNNNNNESDDENNKKQYVVVDDDDDVDDTNHMDLTLDQWKFDFCQKYKGKHFMFVGDSIMGQTFTSFVHLLGGIHESQLSYNNNNNSKYSHEHHHHHHEIFMGDLPSLYRFQFILGKQRRSKRQRRFHEWCGSCVKELALTTMTCIIPPPSSKSSSLKSSLKSSSSSSLLLYKDKENNDHEAIDENSDNGTTAFDATGGTTTTTNTIRATFFRNDYLSLYGISASRTVTTPIERPERDPKEIRVDWIPHVVDESVDFLILNTGRHYRPMDEYIDGIHTTLTGLEEIQRKIKDKHNNNTNNTTANSTSTSSTAQTPPPSTFKTFFMSTKVERFGRNVVSHNQEEGDDTIEPNNNRTNLLCYTTTTTTTTTSKNHTSSGGDSTIVPYHLNEIEDENSRTKLFLKTYFPYVHYLDYSCLDLLNENNAGNRDEAHSCMPGPIDYRIYTFLQILLR